MIDKVEHKIEEIANKNQSFLDSGKIVPLSEEWPFSTNGLYLLIASQGCGKSRFIIKHILMADTINDGNPYYSLICYCSTSGEMDRTVQSYLESGIIKTPLIQVPDTELLDFLNKHLHRKKKYYSMIEYLQRKVITPTLQHSIDKHSLKVTVPKRSSLKPLVTRRQYSERQLPDHLISVMEENNIEYVEIVNKPKLINYITQKIMQYDVHRTILPLLVVLDDFASHKLIERRETPLCKLMTKCRHNHCTFMIAVQTAKHVNKTIRRMATDIVLWQGVSEEDFDDVMKEISYAYPKEEIWDVYRILPSQYSYLQLNVKNRSWTVERVEI
jgi:hypothetical protein